MVRAGAILAGVTAAVHILVGTYDTLLPLLDTPGLTPAVRGTLHACWHFLGFVLAFSAWRFWRGGPDAPGLAAVWIGGALCFALVGLWQAGLAGLVVLPQWVFLSLAGGLVMAGMRRA